MAKAKKKSMPAKKKSAPAKKALTKPAKKTSPKSKAKASAKKVAPKKSAPIKKASGRPLAKPAMTSTGQTVTKQKSEGFFKSFLKPLDDRIVVLMSEGERMTAGGLYIPDTVADVSGNFQGKVMAIGRGHMNKKGKVKPLDVSVGDKVVFSQFSGSRIEMDGTSIMVIRESDVLGIMK